MLFFLFSLIFKRLRQKKEKEIQTTVPLLLENMKGCNNNENKEINENHYIARTRLLTSVIRPYPYYIYNTITKQI